MQEQQAEPERKGEHDADRHVALRQLLAQQAHPDPARDREQHEAP